MSLTQIQMKRQKSILRPGRQYKLKIEDPIEIQAIPLPRINKKAQRKICKCPDLGELPTSLYRFGPVYYEDNLSESAKEEAWKQILKESPGEDEETIDAYLSAIRRVEKTARDTYAEEALKDFTESQFRWIMIIDGCLFLQLALFILGASKELGYSDNHIIFGKKLKKDQYVWEKSMFYVGNQIPVVLLNELMKQTFFQNVIKGYAKWERPTDLLSERVLFDLLILPAAEFAGLRIYSISAYLLEEQPSDLLHGLQNLVLGRRNSRNDSNQEEDEDDMEEGGDLEAGAILHADKVSVDNDRKEQCVSGCVKKGICFWKLSNGCGIRGIEFKNRVLYAGLYLPTIQVNRDTEMLLKNLKYYEIRQQKNDVRSYLGLMNQLILTYQDVNQLASMGIIEVKKPHHKDKFLRMLKNLSETPTATNHDHRHVMQQLRDYSRFPWEKFKYVAIIAFFLTIAQTLFGVLSYVEQLHQSHS